MLKPVKQQFVAINFNMKKTRNPYARELWRDKRYMKKVCPNKKERKEYEEALKRMDREAAEVMRIQKLQYGED